MHFPSAGLATLLVLFGGTTASCALSHGIELEADAPSTIDGGAREDGPLTCPLEGGDIVLEPLAGNPASCAEPLPCHIWFGHGQHLSCPRFVGPPSPVAVGCDIWDCICDDGSGFVGNFATGEMRDSRGGRDCFYRLVSGG